MGIQKVCRELKIINNMKKKLKFNLLIFYLFTSLEIIACNNISSKSDVQQIDLSVSYKKTRDMFIVAHNKLNKIRTYNFNQKTLITPTDDAIIFYETFYKHAPVLIKNTKFFHKDLLQMLKDSSILKNEEFNNDIVRLLYNSSIEDYTLIIDSLFSFYKNNQIEFDAFEHSIIQNSRLSLLVRLNCGNSNLIHLLNKIKKNQDPKQRELNKIIESILNCEDLNGAKEMNKFQPPFFKSIN